MKISRGELAPLVAAMTAVAILAVPFANAAAAIVNQKLVWYEMLVVCLAAETFGWVLVSESEKIRRRIRFIAWTGIVGVLVMEAATCWMVYL